MSFLEAIILGIIQGLTEFLPVSSSGHLLLGQYLFGYKNLSQYLLFSVVCHLGTLVALFVVFLEQIKGAIFKDRSQLIQIILGSLPLFPLVLLLNPIKKILNQPEYLGFCFLITAALLFCGQKTFRIYTSSPETKRWKDPLIIGVFQAAAIFPGISRSGATISAGRMLGWEIQEAVTFSFLLGVPAVLGSFVLEISQLLLQMKNQNSEIVSIGIEKYLIGFFVSLGVGYLGLRFLFILAARDKFMWFVWYCLFLGIMTLFHFNQ